MRLRFSAAFEVVGQPRELAGSDAQRFRRVLAYFGNNAFIEVADHLFHIVFKAVAASAEMLIDVAPEPFERTCGWLTHTAPPIFARAFSIAREDAAVNRWIVRPGLPEVTDTSRLQAAECILNCGISFQAFETWEPSEILFAKLPCSPARIVTAYQRPKDASAGCPLPA